MPELSETDLGIGGSGVAAANKALKSDGAGNSDWGDIKGTEIDSESATSGHVLSADGAGGTTWEASAGGGGTVTSVAVSGSDGVEVDSGSPITGAGTIALGLNKTTTLSTLNVEDGADVTDATNVDSAGAVMESDFTTAFSLLVQQSGTGSPESLTVGTNTILGRVTGGGSEIDDLTPTQVRSLLNVEDGATADQTDAEILTAVESESGRDMSVDGTKLDGIEASADVTDETNVVAALSGATLTDAGTPAGTDKVLIQDTSDSNNLKYVDVNDLPSGGGGGSGLTSAEVFKQSLQTMAILPPEFTYTNDGTYGFGSKTNDLQNLVSLTCNTGVGAYAIATRQPRSTGSTLGIWNRAATDAGADFSKTIRIGGRMLLRFGGSNANWGVDDVVRIKFGDIGEKLAGDLAESRLNFDAKTGDFTVGLVVTGGTSGATGTITSVGVSGTTGSLGLSGVSGTFANNEQLTDTSTGVADVNGSITNDQAVCIILKKPATGDYPDVYLQHASGGTVTTSAKITQTTFYRTNASSYYFEVVIDDGNLSFSVNGTQMGATMTGVYAGNTSDSDLQFENDRTAGTGASSSYVSFGDIKFYGETY